MSYDEEIGALATDPEQLEQVYHQAIQSGEMEAFKQAIDAGHTAVPHNLLYAAWYYRLKTTAAQAQDFVIAWAWAIPLALINGLLFWWISDERFMINIEGFGGATRNSLPAILFLAGPIAAVILLIYLAGAGQRNWRLGALIGFIMLASAAYALLLYPQLGIVPFQEQYLTLMVMHLALLAWAGVGAFLIARHRDPANRFAFLIKSLEVIIVGGLFLIALGIFTGITIGLFEALDVSFPESVQRLFFAGGAGIIVVMATAVSYNPTVTPNQQSFDEGLSKLLALLMRALLPLTLLVLLVYLIFIPFNFWAPFESRDVLIIYNAMLFAIVLLLMAATPRNLADISPRMARWLRRGIIAVAALALLVSLYALSAMIYRTRLDGITPNRLTFIGWNIINIGLLFLLLLLQMRVKNGRWLPALHRAYSAGTVAYAVWTLSVILALPWLFGGNQEAVEGLPINVQRIIYEYPSPILLKCTGSPHIYLLEQGEKRWIDSIETFNERGYVWRDVRFVPCSDLRSIPDGVPIPANAGPPPQP